MLTDNYEKFNRACQELLTGAAPEQILQRHPEIQGPDAERFLVAAQLFAMPKKAVPKPDIRRKYLLSDAAIPQGWITGWLHLSRWATVSAGALLMAAVLGGTGYAAERSVAGEKLFLVKRAVENLQFQLAGSPEAKVSLHIQIVQKRLEEAQTVLTKPQADADQQTAAIKELAVETENAVAAISQAALDKDAPLPAEKNQSLLASLDNLAAQQQILLKELGTQGDQGIRQNALAATKEGVEKVAQVKRYLAAAESEQQNVVGDVAEPAATSSQPTIASFPQATAAATGQTLKKIIPSWNAPTTTKPATVAAPPIKDPNTAIGSFIIEDPSPQTGF